MRRVERLREVLQRVRAVAEGYGPDIRRDAPGLVGIGEYRLHRCVADDETNRVVRQLEVDHHRHAAGPHRAEEDLEELDPVEGEDADPVARFHAGMEEAVGDRVAGRVELAEAVLSRRFGIVVVDDRDAVGSGMFLEDVSEISGLGRSHGESAPKMSRVRA